MDHQRRSGKFIEKVGKVFVKGGKVIGKEKWML